MQILNYCILQLLLSNSRKMEDEASLVWAGGSFILPFVHVGEERNMCQQMQKFTAFQI